MSDERWGLGVAEQRVGLLGATSLVGECLLLLTGAGWRVTAFSRRAVGQLDDGVEWRRLPSPLATLPEEEGEYSLLDLRCAHLGAAGLLWPA